MRLCGTKVTSSSLSMLFSKLTTQIFKRVAKFRNHATLDTLGNSCAPDWTENFFFRSLNRRLNNFRDPWNQDLRGTDLPLVENQHSKKCTRPTPFRYIWKCRGFDIQLRALWCATTSRSRGIETGRRGFAINAK